MQSYLTQKGSHFSLTYDSQLFHHMMVKSFNSQLTKKMFVLLAFFSAFALSAQIDVTSDGKVKKEILTEGTGPTAQRGQTVEVHYVGTLTNGEKFDSSRDRGQPFVFTIGQGVITGWSVGVATMKVGEKARFTIDYEYAYGERGFPPVIPAKATLIFEIELLKIR
ncbi:FKBP-type peptidyl-prolyl cis-trans isomerase [Tritrichomonas foetus]|uniref:peptidylprolyl isomerase n=1 Tax=Tritrichomonas foetus TaxID=1144522 RepID=A0A1J4JKZ9_9EUKA|nr:FKBP-type peptidyl-prolyl cis-trans isomerase [Tritrichomonas foetus]|eukprot:OHS97940.1 FKBP-type peptidyl-prolyl cis-trans isomerase [Tritrichomonas foetus]